MNQDNKQILQQSLRGTKQSLVPKLRFPEFDGEWERNSFKDIVKINQGLQIAISERFLEPEEGTLFYITNEFLNPKSDKRFYIKNPSQSVICNEDDILMTRTGNTGKVVTNVKGAFHNNFFKIAYPNYINKIFLYSFLILPKTQNLILRLAGTSTIPDLNHSDFYKIKFKYPSQPEQQKIAAFLSAVDTRIQTLEQKKALLEQYKKGVMQKIFKQEIRFKDENGEEFPEWKKKKLGDLTYKVGKKNKDNIQYPIYSINNQDGFRPQSEQFDGLDSNDRGYDISMYKIVNEKTFAYNPARINVGSIGYSFDLNEVIISSLYVCFKTKEELEDSYLLSYLDTDRFNKDILRYQEGGVRQYLFYENFSQIKIPLPSNKEQNKIAQFLTTIDNQIETVNQKLEHNKTYKKGLLQQMFV